MSAATWENTPVPTSAVRLPLRTRLRHLNETVRYAPAPYFAGSVRDRLRYVAYVVGSMVAWGAGGLLITAALGRALAAL